MYLVVQAVDSDRDEGPSHAGGNNGTHHRVESNKLEVTVRYPGSPDGGMVIKADSFEQLGTGERGGEAKKIHRDASIYLEPQDVQKIVAFAIAEGCVPVPGKGKLVEAKKAIEQALAAMESPERETP